MEIDRLSRVQQYKSDVAFKTLVDGVNENLYFIPKYQRAFCWKESQTKDLIRSLVKGYPIPPIYAYRNKNGQLEILDGQQRIMSLFFYYIGKFIKASSADLKNVDIEGKTFQQAMEEIYDLKPMTTILNPDAEKLDQIDISYRVLPQDIKRKLNYTTITIIELRWENIENRPEDIQEIFKNLNSNSTKLSPQQIRNGVYNCLFYEMIRDINKNNIKWRAIWGNSNRNEEDMEFLLRLCTVRRFVSYNGEDFVIESYPQKYYAWIDIFSAEAQNMEKTDMDGYRESLEGFFDNICVEKVLGSYKTLLEGLYVVYEKAGIRTPITWELLKEVKEAPEYKETARQGTVKKSSMSKRWKKIYEILSKSVE